MVARLTQLPRPFIVAVIAERTSTYVAAVMERAASAGAHAFELNIPLVESHDLEGLRAILARSERPVYTSCRRAAFMEVYALGAVPDWDDEERMARQLDLLKQGSVALDIELDAFDTVEASGVARDEAAERKQVEIARAAHELGKEVIFSCHAVHPLSQAEIIERVRLAERRGGDMAKVVAPARNEEQVFEYLAAAAAIRRAGMLPTTIVGSGAAGRITRLVAPAVGHSWALCQERVTDGGFPEQPSVAQAREALRLLHRPQPLSADARPRSDHARTP